MEFTPQLLADVGSTVAFMSFLIWQYARQQKQLEKMRGELLTRIKEIEDRADEKEQKLRARYDAVIKGKDEELNSYRDERTMIRTNLGGLITKLQCKIDELIISLKPLNTTVDQNSVRLNEGLDLLKEWRAEMKIKEQIKQAKGE